MTSATTDTPGIAESPAATRGERRMRLGATATLDDFIVVLDDAVPSDFSQRLLTELAGDPRWEPGTVERGRDGAKVRNCHVLDVTHPETVGESATRHELVDEATSLAGTWARAYEAATVPIGLSGRTGLGLARYDLGGYYRSHHDNHADEARTVTMIAVLHTEFTGGELAFFRGERVVALRPGQVCLFPATFQYPHAVQPVRTGTRYSLLTWLR